MAEAETKTLEQESREETGRQKTLARELEWISASPKARQESKARILPMKIAGQGGEATADTAQSYPCPTAPRQWWS